MNDKPAGGDDEGTGAPRASFESTRRDDRAPLNDSGSLPRGN